MVLGGGSIIFWGVFGIRGTTKLAPITTRLDSKGYVDILESHLLPSATDSA